MASCSICAHSPSAPLVEVAADGGRPGRLDLCRYCLERRELARWSPYLKGREVAARLSGRGRRTERFAYFQGRAGDVHLLRLRPEWVRSHTEPPLQYP